MAPSSPVTHFCGSWVLDAGTCQYEIGTPPLAGVYRIEDKGSHLRFSIDWTSADGSEHTVAFEGVADGVAHPYPDPNVADTLQTRVVDPQTLDTSITKGGMLMAHASRQLGDDGQTMKVTQRIRVGMDWKNNVAVYRRSDGG